jgi:hypothetical protein
MDHRPWTINRLLKKVVEERFLRIETTYRSEYIGQIVRSWFEINFYQLFSETY